MTRYTTPKDNGPGVRTIKQKPDQIQETKKEIGKKRTNNSPSPASSESISPSNQAKVQDPHHLIPLCAPRCIILGVVKCVLTHGIPAFTSNFKLIASTSPISDRNISTPLDQALDSSNVRSLRRIHKRSAANGVPDVYLRPGFH